MSLLFIWEPSLAIQILPRVLEMFGGLSWRGETILLLLSIQASPGLSLTWSRPAHLGVLLIKHQGLSSLSNNKLQSDQNIYKHFL